MKAEARAKQAIERMKGKSPYDGSWCSWKELEKLLVEVIRDCERDATPEKAIHGEEKRDKQSSRREENMAYPYERMEDKILMAVAETYPYTLLEIAKAYDRLKSFDDVVEAAITATHTRCPIVNVVDDIQARKAREVKCKA